jgi:serine/threonine-protein kinase
VNPGTIVDGKYKIERQLGEGGMATVYAATHMHLNEQVAIKVLLANLAGNKNIVERFMREARAAVRLKSEHVVRVKDVGSLPSQQPYIVMEFLNGTDLEAALAKRGKMPAPEVVDYVLQVCEALAEAHSIGIVHRDIKPANCVLSTRNDGMPSIKVLDFGIAKMLLGDDAAALTATSATMGTPAFMSPEQIRGAKDVDHRGDIWSVGVMLYELIMGHVPFQANTYGLLVKAVMMDPTPPMQGVPPALEQVIGRCLAKDRANRYQNIGELAQALEPFAASRAEAAVIAQRSAALALPPGQRAQTPAPGVPLVAPRGPATPPHGNYPMSTPAHGNPPHMVTPAQGNQPYPNYNYPTNTPAVGMPHGQGQHPMFTPAHGNQPMMTTPAQGMPPGYPMTTPAQGMPHGQPQHPMFNAQSHAAPNRSTHGTGNAPSNMMGTGAPNMMSTGPHQPSNMMNTGPTPAVVAPAQTGTTSPVATAEPAEKSSRVLVFIVIGILVGAIAGAAVIFAS